jgi:hypothetical protein
MRIVVAMLWPTSRHPITIVHLVVAVLVVMSHLAVLRSLIVDCVRCGVH